MRLFVAVDLDEKIREKISKVCERVSSFQGIKPVEKENLHITLMFLGEVNEARVEKIREMLSSIEFDPFKIGFRGIGFFPKKGAARVVWVGISEGEVELRNLANEVASKLRKLGFKRDKEFTAHTTVARIKKKVDNLREALIDFENYDFGSMIVESFKLKQSILRPSGPIYRDVEIFKAKS
jgi:2'-5' RNA ligase